MRTNIDIDDELMQEAMEVSGRYQAPDRGAPAAPGSDQTAAHPLLPRKLRWEWDLERMRRDT
jgi:Arc/MetJ family transcription regulator